MSAIKVGDYVEVKTWEEMKQEFELKTYKGMEYLDCDGKFTERMKPLCGERFEVLNFDEESKTVAMASIPEVGMFRITSDMVKVVDRPEQNTEENASDESLKGMFESEEKVIEEMFKSLFDDMKSSMKGMESSELRTLEARLGETVAQITELLDTAKEQIEIKQKEEEAKVEELAKPKKYIHSLDELEEGTDYAYISDISDEYKEDRVRTMEFNDDNTDEVQFGTANMYTSEECALEDMKAFELYRKLSRFAEQHNDEIDMKDFDQEKWYIAYEYDDQEFVVSCEYYEKPFGTVFFSSSEIAELAIAEFNEELLEYYLKTV